jgi:hypothetical protein
MIYFLYIILNIIVLLLEEQSEQDLLEATKK